MALDFKKAYVFNKFQGQEIHCEVYLGARSGANSHHGSQGSLNDTHGTAGYPSELCSR